MRVVNFVAIADGYSNYTNDEIRAAVEKGAALNVCGGEGWTPLIAFALDGNDEMVSLLLRHGADPHMKTNSGTDALDWALEFGYTACESLLIQAGLSVRTRIFSGPSRDIRNRALLISNRIDCARKTAACILCADFRTQLGLQKDITRLLARAVWSTRFEEGWDMKIE